MKRFFVTTLTAGALASAALGLAATANAAPSGLSSVDQTVSQLRSQGYQVVMNRVGTAALPVHDQRGPAWPDVFTHRLWGSRRRRRHRHDGDQ